MNRKPLMGALLVAAASLLATGAYADNNKGAGGSEKAAEKKADNAENKAVAADTKGKPDMAGDKADKGKPGAEDRGAKKAKEHEALKEKLKAKLKGAPDAAMKEELRRHAERIAKLERIKAVADTEKDTTIATKATALIDKENARHDKWMDKHASGATATTTATPATAPSAMPATPTTGGSK